MCIKRHGKVYNSCEEFPREGRIGTKPVWNDMSKEVGAGFGMSVVIVWWSWAGFHLLGQGFIVCISTCAKEDLGLSYYLNYMWG